MTRLFHLLGNQTAVTIKAREFYWILFALTCFRAVFTKGSAIILHIYKVHKRGHRRTRLTLLMYHWWNWKMITCVQAFGTFFVWYIFLYPIISIVSGVEHKCDTSRKDFPLCDSSFSLQSSNQDLIHFSFFYISHSAPVVQRLLLGP